MYSSIKIGALIILITCLTLTGCSDSKTTITTPPPVDTAPPAVPTGLTACAGDCVIKLSWDPNVVDSDLQGFNVYRMYADQTWDLTATPVSNSYFVDCDPLSGSCIYRVTAVDFTGNESGWAQLYYKCWSPDAELHRP